jgi:hypothetical protein
MVLNTISWPKRRKNPRIIADSTYIQVDLPGFAGTLLKIPQESAI